MLVVDKVLLGNGAALISSSRASSKGFQPPKVLENEPHRHPKHAYYLMIPTSNAYPLIEL